MVESSTLAVDGSELDLSAADNTSVATSGRDDAWLAGSVGNSCHLKVPVPACAIAERDRSTDMGDSTEDELGTSRCLWAALIINDCSVTYVILSCTSALPI